MASLVEQIEKYLKKMLNNTNGQLRLQRNELAELFNCVPSQINYVLKTRFTIERGYLVESQRGGGGFIEIQELITDHLGEDVMYGALKIIGDRMSEQQAIHMILYLEENEILTSRESAILQTIMRRRNLAIDLPYRDFLRAKLLKSALGALMKNESLK